MKRPLSVLIKPTSSRCNLNCSYCFYLEKQAIYPWRDHPTLSIETYETFLRQYAGIVGSAWSFAWQGGEPTLMGLPFFESVVALQARVARELFPGRPTTIGNALQTNGTLLTDDWARFFKKWNVLVGVSVDGPPEWHNIYRVDYLNRATFERVMTGIEQLRRHDVEFNILTVVNHTNVQRPRELFQWLMDQGFDNLQFIPCVEPRPGHESVRAGGTTDESITPDEYGHFLNAIFDEWLKVGVRTVRIRLFDNLIQMLWGMATQLCQLAPSCGYIVLEHNGDCYPCDFFVETDWKLGNIHQTPLQEMIESDRFRRFSQTKRHVNNECLNCRWRPICHGECPRYRITNVGKADYTLPYFCASYKQFYGQSYPRLEKVAVELGQEMGLAVGAGHLSPAQRTHAPSLPLAVQPLPSPRAADATIGRNDRCPCGSGKKYKRCCGSIA